MSKSDKWQQQVAKFQEKNARRRAEKKALGYKKWKALRDLRTSNIHGAYKSISDLQLNEASVQSDKG